MNVQLLLLLALVGPFCAFTRASPTELPTELTTDLPAQPAVVTDADAGDVPEVTEAAKDEMTVVTGAPATEPAAAPEEVVTEVFTEAATVLDPVATEEAVLETEGPVVSTAAPEPHITEAPAVETAAPTEAAEVEDEPAVTAAAEVETDGEVVIEEGLSSGQVVGIVIGALLAVIIVIAVVIAAVRRMGKYSP